MLLSAQAHSSGGMRTFTILTQFFKPALLLRSWSWLLQMPQELGRRENRNTFVRGEFQQIPVATDDRVGLPGHGQRKELVVVWITTSTS